MDPVAATEANLSSMWAQFGRGDGCVLVDDDRMLRFETPIPFPPYNSVMRFTVDGDADGLIDETLSHYLQRDVAVMWVVHPSTRPADIAARLERRGLVEAEVVPGMVADLDDVPEPDPGPEGIEIEEIGPEAHEPFIELVAYRYSLPEECWGALRSIMERARFAHPDAPTRGWIARRGDRVLSKVVLHLGAGVAGIYGVATREEARGLGLARTLTLHALQAARELGMRTAVLHSTAMAENLYRSIGFEQVCEFRLYSQPDRLHL